jgi:CRP-like cAMP-binding protein
LVPDAHAAGLRAELLRAPLLAALSTAQLDRVVRRSALIGLDAGQLLFRQDEPARRFYFVRAGRVRLFRLSGNGDEKVIELIGPGQTFAEALLFMGTGRYPVCAAALTEARLVSIDAEDFAAMLRESPDTCFALLGDLSRRLHALIAEIDSLTLHSAQARVARWLLRRSSGGEATIALDVSKSVLASRLSIQPETWSRVTRRLSDRGVIRVDGARVEILDRSLLASVADEL